MSRSRYIKSGLLNRFKNDTRIKPYVWTVTIPDDYRIFFNKQPPENKIKFPFMRIQIIFESNDNVLPENDFSVQISLFAKGNNAEVIVEGFQEAVNLSIDNNTQEDPRQRIDKAISLPDANVALMYKESSSDSPTGDLDIIGKISRYRILTIRR